jgi:hypothetical protein
MRRKQRIALNDKVIAITGQCVAFGNKEPIVMR